MRLQEMHAVISVFMWNLFMGYCFLFFFSEFL
jgi:hypothetical protein